MSFYAFTTEEVVDLFQIFKEHKGFSKQIFLLAKNELIKTYKGAVIGPFWAVIKPAFTLFVYWFAFTVGIKDLGAVNVSINGEFIATFDRFTFMIVGFIPWFFISDSITQGAKSIRLNRQFVTKVSFPVSTIITYTSLARLYVHFLLSAIMFLYVSLISGVGVSIYNLQFFLYCPLMFAFFVVLAWSTAPMSAFSADFENMIVSIMSGIFWVSGVIYSSYDFTSGFLKYLMLINPINFFANGYRNAFLYQRWFFEYPLELIIFLIEFAVIFALGIFNYNRLRKRLPDVL
ncbi:MAG: ABC transporter permease [Ruminococcus sp.]|nr:ABC transporter permease [Ruminococcus sp.]